MFHGFLTLLPKTFPGLAVLLVLSMVRGPGVAAQGNRLPAWLSVSVGLETEMTHDTHSALGTGDARTELSPLLELEANVEAGGLGDLFIALEFAPKIVVEAPAESATGARLLTPRVQEMFVLLPQLFQTNWTLRLGRQGVEDTRHWLFDDEVDALRASYRTSRFSLDIAATQEALSAAEIHRWKLLTPENYFWLYGQYELGQQWQLAAYSLVQKNRQENTQLFFFGLQNWRKRVTALSYWLNLAYVYGTEEGRQVQGWGGDISLMYTFDPLWRPAVMLGAAFGSGDTGGDEGRDHAFRQTGLEGNNAELTGNVDIQYYGEIFSPELSNMLILTAGAGVRPLPKLAFTVLYHDYQQHRAAAELRDVRITAEPSGRNRALGRELDFIGSWIINKVELKLVLGAFWPGRAFDEASAVTLLAQGRIRIEFK